jgi:hypothetical protein
MHACRPLLSVVLKMFCWMLEKVGCRSGVGPARSLRLSSQLDAPTARAAASKHRFRAWAIPKDSHHHARGARADVRAVAGAC